MVTRYPHTASVFVFGQATKDANGDWIKPASTQIFKDFCRADSSSNSGYITGADGKQIAFSWIIYFPRVDMTGLPVGSQMTVVYGSIGIAGGGVSPVATSVVLEIPITSSMSSPDGSVYAVSAPLLMGQSFKLERRGMGLLASTEYSVSASGGFTLASATQDPVHAGEMFFATVSNYTNTTGGLVVTSASGSEVFTGTIKRFSRGQLNCRAWV